MFGHCRSGFNQRLAMSTSPAALHARDVYQVLKDAAMGTLTLRKLGENMPGQIQVDIGGWSLTLITEGSNLSHCQGCEAPDGRRASQDNWPRYGTDPVKLLSLWEHQQLQQLLQLAGPVQL
jgi:hypothetical protein